MVTLDVILAGVLGTFPCATHTATHAGTHTHTERERERERKREREGDRQTRARTHTSHTQFCAYLCTHLATLWPAVLFWISCLNLYFTTFAPVPATTTCLMQHRHPKSARAYWCRRCSFVVRRPLSYHTIPYALYRCQHNYLIAHVTVIALLFYLAVIAIILP